MARLSRSAMTGSFTVGGIEGRWPSQGAAISRALTAACRADDEKQLGVFDDGVQVARVRRHRTGVVTVEVRDGEGWRSR